MESLPREHELSAAGHLAERIRHWNQYFLTAPEESRGPDTVMAMAELDELLAEQGVMGERCLIKGEGLWSLLQIDASEPQSHTSHSQDYQGEFNFRVTAGSGQIETEAVSNGFAFLDPEDQGHPRAFYQFLTSNLEMYPHATVGIEFQSLVYLDPDKSFITTVDTFEDPFYEHLVPDEDEGDGFVVEPAVVLSNYSRQLVKLIKSTAFRRLKHRQQIQAVDNLIRQAEKYSLIKQAEVVLDPQYAYLSWSTPEGDIDNQPISLSGLCLQGLCLGLTMVGRHRLQNKAIRRDSDAFSVHEGLAMSIELGEEITVREAGQLAPGTMLQVPISGQSMKFLMQPNSQLYGDYSYVIED